ncbi:acyltransferase [Sphingobium sp. SCG-1]|uniref:acyltransferase n=1 Tax=Sphingobium sp. SCG-1 TaxID=2072936 RepID=UPI0016709962|nr:acyltransferase [Sphingobium sp. SCG-1]
MGFIRYKAAISPRADVETGAWLSVGHNSRVSSFVRICSNGGPVVIGPNTDIGVSSFIGGGREGVRIGRNCLISPHCWIGTSHYEVPASVKVPPDRKQGMIVIGDNVWVGAGAVILDDVAVGSGAIISPNSVVTSNIPENAIVQGNPAKTIFIRR